MADRPIEYAVQPADVVGWTSVSRMLGLMAVVLSKVKSVRLLGSEGVESAELLDCEMPPLADLVKVVDTLYGVSNRTGSGALRSEAASSAGHGNDHTDRILKAREQGHRSVETAEDVKTAISALLWESPGVDIDPSVADATRWPILHDSSDVRASNALLVLRNALAHGTDVVQQPRDNILEISVAPGSGSWSINLVTPRRLQGEDLGQLHAAAPTSTMASGPESGFFGEAYLSAAEAAKSLGVAKSTVTRRVERNEMVGFRTFKQALRIPKDQFLDGDVVPGIRDVLLLFARPNVSGKDGVDHKSAWLFLGGEIFHGDSDPRPIDRLRRAARSATTEQIVADLVRVKRSVDRGDHI